MADESQRRRSFLPEDWEAIDSLESFHDAIRACGEQHRAGQPLGPYFRSMREPSGSQS